MGLTNALTVVESTENLQIAEPEGANSKTRKNKEIHMDFLYFVGRRKNRKMFNCPSPKALNSRYN
jgi:hypothetical protein